MHCRPHLHLVLSVFIANTGVNGVKHILWLVVNHIWGGNCLFQMKKKKTSIHWLNWMEADLNVRLQSPISDGQGLSRINDKMTISKSNFNMFETRIKVCSHE